jgi:hypothetical protein
MMAVELIGIPRQAWGLILLIELPGTILGVFVITLIEYGVARYLRRRSIDGTRPANPSSVVE